MNDKQLDLASLAKQKLVKFVGEIDVRLEKLWNSELQTGFGYGESQKKLVEKMLLHAKEHNLRSSKRLRSAFVYYAYNLNKDNDLDSSEEIWKVAESVELIHTALLMHDDFMDKDVVRRGKPTTQEYFAQGDSHYGDSMAVCLGDAVLCLGFERFLSTEISKEKVVAALRQMMRGVANTAYGQAFDSSLAKEGDLDEQKVLDLHMAKTAIYSYENPLLSGAILAGLTDEVIEVLKRYSSLAGVAFQLQDDVLGVFGDEEKTGKSNNSDLLQGKVTLLIVKVMELGSEEEKEAVVKVWGKESSSLDDIELAKKAIVSSGSYQYSVDKAKQLASLGVKEANDLDEMGLNKDSVDFLVGIAEYMVNREV